MPRTSASSRCRQAHPGTLSACGFSWRVRRLTPLLSRRVALPICQPSRSISPAAFSTELRRGLVRSFLFSVVKAPHFTHQKSRHSRRGTARGVSALISKNSRVGHFLFFSAVFGWWVELFTITFRRVQRFYAGGDLGRNRNYHLWVKNAHIHESSCMKFS